MLKFVSFFACLALVHSALIPVGYKFGYNIDSTLDGQSREESRDENGNVSGYYTLRDADGRTRRVNYRAGAEGFHAEIDSNEQGVLARSSANARYNGAELPSPAPQTDPLPLSVEASGEQVVPVGYKFGYDVQGPSDSHSREESSDNGKVSGSYSLRDADGRSRRVEYTADSQGFKATIHTNEQGTASRNPADVVLNSALPVPVPVESLPVTVPAVSGELSYAPELSQAIVHELPESRPLLVQPLREPVQQEYLKTPITQELNPPPAPSRIYTSKSHSSLTFSKVAAAQDPIVQTYERPREIIQESKQERLSVKSAPVEQRFADPISQEIKQEPLPVKSAPIEQKYRSSVHSSIKYLERADAPSDPISQEIKLEPLPVKSAPIVQEYKREPLPVKSAPTPAPVYQSRVFSSIQYTKKPIVQEQLSVKSEPLATKSQTAETFAIKSAPATKSLRPAAEAKSFGTRIEHSALKGSLKSL